MPMGHQHCPCCSQTCPSHKWEEGGEVRVTSPIGRILGGSSATVATVATVETITRCGFFSCNLKDHFREIRQIPVGLQQTWKEIW